MCLLSSYLIGPLPKKRSIFALIAIDAVQLLIRRSETALQQHKTARSDRHCGGAACCDFMKPLSRKVTVCKVSFTYRNTADRPTRDTLVVRFDRDVDLSQGLTRLRWQTVRRCKQCGVCRVILGRNIRRPERSEGGSPVPRGGSFRGTKREHSLNSSGRVCGLVGQRVVDLCLQAASQSGFNFTNLMPQAGRFDRLFPLSGDTVIIDLP